MKDNIIFKIIASLKKVGVHAKVSDNTDLVIDMEFLDAKWSTGEKKISYESSILVNEDDNTIYMYEKTSESGGGFGFGMNTDSSVQSGSTLFRKVKAVTYGPEGEVINIEIDLGMIPKTIKEIAKEYGYKFKTVIFKKKAQYSGGVKPIVVPIMEQQEIKEEKLKNTEEKKVTEKVQPLPLEQTQTTQTTLKPVKEEIPKSLLISVGVLSVITILLYLLVSVNTIGWILGTGVIVGVFFLAKRIGKPIVTFILLIPAFIVLFFIMAITMESGSNGSIGDNGSFGPKVDNSKNLVSFEMNVPSPWTQLEPTMNIYSKFNGDIYSSFNVMQTNDEIDDDFYKDYKNLDYDKYYTGVSGYIKTDKIEIGNWDALKLEFVQEDVGVTTYMYFINIPGKIDLYGIVGSTSDDIDQIAKECEQYMAKINLKYE